VAWRVTPFYTSFENLSDLYMDSNTGVTQYANLGNGRSSGVELYVRKKMSDKWQGWVSYTYGKSRANRADLGVVDTMYYTPWDQRSTLSLVTDYRTGKYSHSLRADLGSGRADRGDPTVQERAGANVVVNYNFSMKLPKGSSMGDSLYVNVFNMFNNHQTMQYNWTGGTRTRDSWVPSRTLCMGVSSNF
jgi:outer membrane receptor protein involved in Fe transport